MAKYQYTSKYNRKSEGSGLSDALKTRLQFGGVFIITLFFALVIWPWLPPSLPGSAFFNGFFPHLGLDLQGGTHLVYEADTSQLGSSEKTAAVEGVRDVIERRVNAYGVAEPVVQTTKSGDSWRVIIELAGVTDVNEAIKLIGETPTLEFKEPQTPEVNIVGDENGQAQINLSATNDTLKETAKDLLDRIKDGADFATLASENSDDTGSKANGGDLGWAARGLFVPEFDKVLFDELQDGELYPELVETQFGYHIIQRLESRTSDNGELEVRGRHILIMRETLDGGLVQNWQATGLTGKQLKNATVNFDERTGQPYVTLLFNSEGSQLFEDITERNIGQQVAIFLDGDIISQPTVQSRIAGGQAQITGSFTLEEAKLLAQRLNAGALPINIDLVSQQTVGATLGEISLQKSLFAGVIGLLLVVLFMILYYRLPGLVSVIALIIYSILSLGIFELIPVTLTLAGIAGFILSIGMAVDANVLIFERLKEELRDGETLKSAIDKGFSRAWLSIRDSNISSLITTFILFWFGSSIIKGFALTLGIGILVSMFSAIFISRNFLKLLAMSDKISQARWIFGVKQKKGENANV